MKNVILHVTPACIAAKKDIKKSGMSLKELAALAAGTLDLERNKKYLQASLDKNHDTVKLGVDMRDLLCILCGEGENSLNDTFDKLKETLKPEQSQKFLLKVIKDLINKIPKEGHVLIEETLKKEIYGASQTQISDVMDLLRTFGTDLRTLTRDVNDLKKNTRGKITSSN
jgi:hypothetical protein